MAAPDVKNGLADTGATWILLNWVQCLPTSIGVTLGLFQRRSTASTIKTAADGGSRQRAPWFGWSNSKWDGPVGEKLALRWYGILYRLSGFWESNSVKGTIFCSFEVGVGRHKWQNGRVPSTHSLIPPVNAAPELHTYDFQDLMALYHVNNEMAFTRAVQCPHHQWYISFRIQPNSSQTPAQHLYPVNLATLKMKL